MQPCLVALALAALPLAGSADTAPPPAHPLPLTAAASAAPPVDQLVAAALAAAPVLAAARAEVAASEATELPAAALPDPMLAVALQNAGLDWTVGKEEMSMLAVELRQSLPASGKRAAARAAAAARTTTARAELVHAERQLVHDLRALYAELYALDAELLTFAGARELLDLLEATHRARYTTGEGDAAALLRAQLERTRLRERETDLEAERAMRAAELNRWLARPTDAPLGPVIVLPAVELPPGSVEELAVHGSAEVALLAARAGEATAALDRRRLDLKPDLSAGAGLGWRGGLDPVVIFGLGVELPAWRRRKQQPLIAAAEHELAATRHRIADAAAMAAAEAATLLTAFRNAERQLVLYRDGLLPQTSAVLDATRASYLSGRAGFGELLEALDAWLAARATLARREADRYAAWAGIEHLARGHREQGDLP